MASSTETLTDDHALELIVRDPSSPASHGGSAADAASGSDEITPLLTQIERPKINIFSASFSRRKPREQVLKVTESESFHIAQFFSWLWSGSRYAGFLCMALSSTLYFMMELISDGLSVQSIPLFETAFMRCTTILILSYLWLRRSGQPIFGPSHARKLLILRALVGYLSLFCFIFSIRMLPLSQAIVLSFASPIMASIAARIILREKLKIIDIGALVCSFFGILFIFRPMITVQVEPEGINGNFKGEHHIYAVLMGLFSSITGGISYCLIKAGAKASEQPLITVLLFGVVACPAAAMCMLAFEDLLSCLVISSNARKFDDAERCSARVVLAHQRGCPRVTSLFRRGTFGASASARENQQSCEHIVHRGRSVAVMDGELEKSGVGFV
ncbi:PREDICTED: uncharacterized protein LOC104815344 isoform X2 [Tarenaya hassleriana]|uniref:uncharacterized protein LOC104815344 isoform X2 n=1 Tax=Tarenaya hassleriana TaxID=28532 RepID=UPI00053CAA1D|nr:PREDICTED: uncharacterized protein LOC104815344 isoform X2 [Tarenaya hassleriana]